jgi:hypothetical protein
MACTIEPPLAIQVYDVEDAQAVVGVHDTLHADATADERPVIPFGLVSER